MTTQDIFGLQFALSIVIFAVVARVYLRPWLGGLTKREALMWLTLPHMFRHVGMVFLVPGMVSDGMPEGFAKPAAYGDLLTGILALAAFVALHMDWRAKFALVWIYTVVGLVDLGKALPQTDVAPFFGAAWYIPTMLVPLLLVTHVMSFARLVRRDAKSEAETRSVVEQGRPVEASR